jgi:hypothetical protein
MVAVDGAVIPAEHDALTRLAEACPDPTVACEQAPP